MHPGSLQGDIEWYCQKAVASLGPVLELGAGTGRISLAVAQAGVRVSAVDLDEGMLEKLRLKIAALPPEAQSRISVHHARHAFVRVERAIRAGHDSVPRVSPQPDVGRSACDASACV